MSASSWILDRNRDLAAAVFGPEDGTEDRSTRDTANDERKAAGLTPFIVAGAAAAAFGGRFGMTPGQRGASAAIAALLFIAI